MSETRTVKLGDVAEFIRGVTFKKDQVTHNPGEGLVACLRTKNIQKKLDLSDIWYIPQEIIKRENQYHKPGDILISSANSYNLVGKCCWIPDLGFPCTFGGFVTTLRIKSDSILPKYLFYWFSSENTQRTIRSLGNQTTNISNLNISRAKQLFLELPSIEEQERIILQKDLENLIEQKRVRQRELLSELEKSVFHQMFDNETEKIKLGYLGKWQSGGTPLRSNQSFFNGNIPWFTSREIGALQVEDSAEHISQDAVDNSAAKLIQPGSLLLGMYDTAALKSSFTTKLATCNQAIAFAKLDETVCAPLFVYYAIQDQKDKILSLRRGIRQKNLNLSMIRDIEISYPSLDKQKQFQHIIKIIQNR